MQRGTKCAENYGWHGHGNICGQTRLNMDSATRYKFAMIQETIKHIILSSHKVTVWGKYDYTTGAGKRQRTAKWRNKKTAATPLALQQI